MKLLGASLLCFCFFIALSHASLTPLAESNWTMILDNEWMVEFFAPWCPACRNLEPTWKSFAAKADGLNIGVAAVDITENPALSAIFFIASLPTIYHVKQGEFRLYEGNRNVQDFEQYVAKEMYLRTEPLPWYVSPGSIHMRLFGRLISACLRIKDFHGYLVQAVGLPAWAAYVLLGAGMLIFGVLFGLMFVVCCDYMFPPRMHLTGGVASKRPRAGPTAVPEHDDFSSGEEKVDLDATTPMKYPEAEEEDSSSEGNLRQRAPQNAGAGDVPIEK